jgi:lambda family phage minor tail protein L
MTFQENIASDVQKLNVGDLVTLYELDLTDVGSDQTLYFTEAIGEDYQPIYFGGQEYQPIQLDSDGWETSGQGTLPRPKLRVSNVLLSFASYVYTFQDMIGAKLTRRRTFKKYLDGEAEANPNAEFAPDIYVIRQKTQQTKAAVEFELSPYMDFEGIKIPKRQILRDFCTHSYRYVGSDGTTFVSYDPTHVDQRVTCKYSSDYYFTRNGVHTTNPANDKCGKLLTDCELRFAGQKAQRLGKSVTISDTEPVGPSDGDVWLNTGTTPNVFEYWSESDSDWLEYKPDPLYTRSFPSVARFQP